MRKDKSIETVTCLSYNAIVVLFLATIPVAVILFFYHQPSVGIFFVLLFIAFLFYVLYRQEKRFLATYDWEKIEANVKGKKIIKYNCISIYKKRARKGGSHKIVIQYEYAYKGKRYKSNQFALTYSGDCDCNFLDTLEGARKLMHNIIQNNNVNVYVNPKKPNESVIVQGKSSDYGISYGIVILYMVFLIYILYRTYGI